MSDTESFERAMVEMQKVVADDCDMERCDMYDGDCYQCQGDILYRLQRAHERELEHVRKAEFARGYDDGQRSMDAEHYAVALRLRGLRFDGGSHGNLSSIAYALYPCATGWTRESSEGLRDRLIDLLGGVHEPDVALPTYDVLGNERHKAVCELRKFKPMIGSRPTEEASKLIRCITGKSDSHVACGNDLEETRDRLIHLLGGDEPFGSFAKSGDFGKLDSTNDGEISNERHKAIAELRKIDTDAGGFVKALANALGVKWQAPRVAQTIAEVRDRLIHLLGGDEPTLSEVGTELSQASVDAMSKRADQSHESSPMSLENETEITDELRKWASDRHCKGMSHTDALNVGLIADRIDEQFKRICEQQEAVLQSAIEQMTDENLTVKDERDHLRRQMDQQRAMLTEQRDEARAKVLKLESENAEWRRGAERDADKLESLTGAYNDAVAERDELRKKLENVLENARDALNEAAGRWAKADEERRELQRRLDAIREAVNAL